MLPTLIATADRQPDNHSTILSSHQNGGVVSRIVDWRLNRLLSLALFGLGAICLFTSPTNAQTSWTNSSGGEFSILGNWDLGTPDSITNANFSLNNTYTVTFSQPGASAQNLNITDGSVTFSGDQTFNLHGPAVIGNQSTADGVSLNLRGGIDLVNTGGFTVSGVEGGVGGYAQLLVFEGSTVTGSTATLGDLSGHRGFARVDGTGSRWDSTGEFLIGRQGYGQLDVYNGGYVTNSNGRIGSMASGEGLVTINGIDGLGNRSTWENTGGLIVGDDGSGTLNIQSGGLVTSDSATIGKAGAGTGTVSVSGTHFSGVASKWEITNDLTVSEGKEGSLNIAAAGIVENVNGFIGSGATGDGTVTVNGRAGS